MFKFLVLGLFLILSVSCSKNPLNGDLEKNLKELDKIYGKCDNPNRQYTKGQYDVCKDKERAAGPDGEIGEPINITEIIENYRSGGKTVYATSAVNTELWNASIAVLENYSLKNIDSQGGFIATDWIMDKKTPNQRCQIKVNIISQELVSNGVDVKILCEDKENTQWYGDNKSYINQEKSLTLKILEIANQLSVLQQS
tara:strand:+ start:612 stop:1205 length:594 start_codon:yes stop_codon:yes gene_type:complete